MERLTSDQNVGGSSPSGCTSFVTMPDKPQNAPFAESLSGLIERVTFFNEENGWAVLKVKAKGHRDQVTVLGSLPSVSAGEWVTAEGRWVQDREFGLQFRPRDKVIQTENDYDKDVFNGDIGQIVKIDPVAREVTIRFDSREVIYDFSELDEISLAYAITIHKSQGSEFPAIVTPLAMQQYMLLQRNLVYTGITRGKKLVVLIGQRKALAMAVKNNRTENRFSGLLARMLAPG